MAKLRAGNGVGAGFYVSTGADFLFVSFWDHDDSQSDLSIWMAKSTDRFIDNDEYYVTSVEKEIVYGLTTTAPLKVLRDVLARDVTMAMAKSVVANTDTIRGEAADRLMDCYEPTPTAIKIEYYFSSGVLTFSGRSIGCVVNRLEFCCRTN